MDFFAVNIVTGSDVKVGMNGKGVDYYSLRNCGNTRSNEELVYLSDENTVSYQKRSYFDVTSGNFANFASEKVHEDKIFGQQDILQFSHGNPTIYFFIPSYTSFAPLVGQLFFPHRV